MVKIIRPRAAERVVVRSMSEAAERVFVQMRIVRDAARHLIDDIERFDLRLRTLQEELEEQSGLPDSLPPTPFPEKLPDRQILRIRDIAQQLGLSRSTIYRLMQRGDFPSQVRLSDHAVGWRAADIIAWLA